MYVPKPGHTVTYRTFCDTLRTVVVYSTEPHKGRPAFSGRNPDGEFWGYDSQIVSSTYTVGDVSR